jgi:hypothetical protein
MQKRKSNNTLKPHPLLGTWVNGDEYATEVEYQVSPAGQAFAVRAIDRYDGEEAEVYEVKWDGGALSFAAHWPSTGRFVKCRLQTISQNRVDLTYTYTQQEMWHRKGAEPGAPCDAGRRRRQPRRSVARRA